MRVRAIPSISLFLALTTGLANVAHGQVAPGYSGSSSVTYIDQAEAMITLSWFGRCYAKKQRDDALLLIATPPGSREEGRVVKKLFRGNIACMAFDTNLRMPVAYIRGVVGEGLLRSGLGVPASHLLSVPRPADARSLSDAARCYASTHKVEVEGLLATKAGSKQEFDAVSVIIDGFAQCLPSQGAQQFDATLVRFRLLEALLRLSPTLSANSGT